jgi:DNA-binding NarL/FixJ family response regulator
LDPAYRPRVVIADDHPLFLKTATALLSPTFDVVAAVAHGEAAIDAAASLDPDIVVLDIAMPGLDGFQTASAILAREPRRRIAFLSAHAEDDYVLEGLKRGASAFIAKPRMLQDLVAALTHAHAGRVCVPSPGVLARWRRPGRRSHDLQLYGPGRSLVDGLESFFGAALEAGDSVIAIARQPHLDDLEQRLNARRFNVAALTASGRYWPLEVEATIDAVVRGGQADESRFVSMFDAIVEIASQAGGSTRHISAFGEMAPTLCDRNQQEVAIALESIADRYAASRDLSLLCGYSADALSRSPDLSACICAAHAAIIHA